MLLKTTLSDIKKHNPCESGWRKLLKYLNKKQPDDESLDFKTILKSNGIADTIWCLRSVEGCEKEIRLFAVWCARQVEHLDKTGTAKITNDVSEKYANGLATDDELAAASTAAWAAATAAAMAAASTAASTATWAAASTAAMAAASTAASTAARAAARAAASTAAMAAASTAASTVALAAAWAAATAAARAAQKEEFIKRFCAG
jgi:hypothetical protein